MYAASALIVALEDLRARQLDISVAASFGGPVRDKVRLYAAFGGYVEGVDPADTWPGDVARILDAGFTAMKFRNGRYPVAHEAALLEQIRAELPDGVDLMADGNAGFTLPRAIEMGRILDSLGYLWFEEPMNQREGYQGYEQLAVALDIALAGGEIMQSRSEAISLLARRAVDIVQPEPVICGGIAETLWIAELAAVHSIAAMPHTSNNAIGIAAGLQALACLHDPTRSPASDQLFSKSASTRTRTEAASCQTNHVRGWEGDRAGRSRARHRSRPGYLRRDAIEMRVIDAAGSRAG